jgi:hypothetical protein
VNEYPLPAWAGFAFGAAVLAGLVLAAGFAQLAPLLVGPRAGRAALTLGVPLGLAVVALCLLVPGQSDTAVGAEIIAVGGVLGLATVMWFGTTTRAEDEPRHARPVTLVAVLLPAVLLLVGGTMLASGSLGGLTWVFAATAVGLVATVVAVGLTVAERSA